MLFILETSGVNFFKSLPDFVPNKFINEFKKDMSKEIKIYNLNK